MIFDRLKKLFGNKPEEKEDTAPSDICYQISQIFVANPHNRKPLIAFLEKELESKVYETTIGIQSEIEHTAIQIVEQVLDESACSELRKYLDNNKPPTGYFYTSAVKGIFHRDAINSEVYLAVLRHPGSLSLTFISISKDAIAAIDSVLRQYAPKIEPICMETIKPYLQHLTGECSNYLDEAGVLERRKATPDWVRLLWERTPKNNRQDIISLIEIWRIGGCEDFLIDELHKIQTEPSPPSYHSDYYWRIALMLALTGKSKKEYVKKALPLFDIINDHGTRHFLLKFVGKTKHPELFDFYARSLKDKTLQEAAIIALGRFDDPAVIPLLKPFLTCGKADLSKVALKALSKLLPPEELPPPSAKPDNLEFVDDKLRTKLARVVRDHGNPVESISKIMKKAMEEFSTSMDAENFAPMFAKLEAAGISGFSCTMGEFLGTQFEKLRDGACSVCTITNGATIFYLILEREDSETLSFWLCSVDIEAMRQINAELSKYLNECEAKLSDQG